MSDAFRFWTHGADVIVEKTKEYTGDDNGLYLSRRGYGAIVRQKANTDNWFHFAIPSATKLDDDNVSHYHAWLRVKVNYYAVIDRIHIREASGPSIECPIIYSSDQHGNISIYDEEGEFDFNLPDGRCTGPLIMCVHVYFHEDAGEVMFIAAGAHFEEWT